jgi:hypothetical protein
MRWGRLDHLLLYVGAYVSGVAEVEVLESGSLGLPVPIPKDDLEVDSARNVRILDGHHTNNAPIPLEGGEKVPRAVGILEAQAPSDLEAGHIQDYTMV